jgi:hypothetical protein
MSKEITVYKEDVWNKVKDIIPILADGARIEVYYDTEEEKLWTSILQGQSWVEVEDTDVYIDTFESLSKFWTEYPYSLEDLVKDEEERKRIEEDEEEFEKFLLDIYEEEYLTNGLSYYEIDV